MELILLGTAAAEGWPAPFCVCHACQEARRLGGRNIRRRSCALLDDVVQIDYGPDTSAQIQACGKSLAPITSMIFTHQHEDHITPHELTYRSEPFITQTQLPMLHLYGNASVVEKLNAEFPDVEARAAKHRLAIEAPLAPFVERETVDGTRVLPLPADHVAGAFVLRITRRGKRIFYGHDSGSYAQETVEALAGEALDAALFDATFGIASSNNRGHMGLDGVIESVARLRAVGAVTDRTQLIATHYSHNGLALYDELCSRLSPHHIAPAYDGMIVSL